MALAVGLAFVQRRIEGKANVLKRIKRGDNRLRRDDGVVNRRMIPAETGHLFSGLGIGSIIPNEETDRPGNRVSQCFNVLFHHLNAFFVHPIFLPRRLGNKMMQTVVGFFGGLRTAQTGDLRLPSHKRRPSR